MQLLQPFIFSATGRRRPLLPGVVSRGRHTEHAGKAGDGVVRLLFLDQAELHLRRSVSRAKKSAALRRISFSSSRILTSRRRRMSSARSGTGETFPEPLVDLGLAHPGAKCADRDPKLLRAWTDAPLADPVEADGLSSELWRMGHVDSLLDRMVHF